MEPLPHRYPFRFVDRTVERAGAGNGSVAALLASGGRGASSGPLPASLVAELMAQAGLLLSGGGPEQVTGGVLAAISGLSVGRAPVAGEALTVRVAVSGRMGPVVKFEAELLDADGGQVAAGSFTIRLGMPSAEATA